MMIAFKSLTMRSQVQRIGFSCVPATAAVNPNGGGTMRGVFSNRGTAP